MWEVVTTRISLNDIRVYAYHGVLPQERTVGGWYTVNVTVDYPFGRALQSDSLDDTLSYADVLDTVLREMAQPSNLIEHVAGRIADALFVRHRKTMAVDIAITKDNPPMGGDTAGATVRLTARNSNVG